MHVERLEDVQRVAADRDRPWWALIHCSAICGRSSCGAAFWNRLVERLDQLDLGWRSLRAASAAAPARCPALGMRTPWLLIEWYWSRSDASSNSSVSGGSMRPVAAPAAAL